MTSMDFDYHKLNFNYSITDNYPFFFFVFLNCDLWSKYRYATYLYYNN